MGLKESGLRGSIRNVSTGIGAAISIDTLEAEDVEADSATIRGEITELTNFGEDAEVFFEWGETTQGLPNTTDIQLQDTVGVFTEDLTNLSDDTTHEFQAFGSVRDVSDDGVVLTFETDVGIPDSEANHQWNHDESSGTVLADSIGPLDGSINGAVFSDESNSLVYDGNGDNTDLGTDSQSALSSFIQGPNGTLSMWINPDSNSDIHQLIGGDTVDLDNSWVFRQRDGGDIEFESQISGSGRIGVRGGDLSTNEFTNVSVILENGVATLYQNKSDVADDTDDTSTSSDLESNITFGGNTVRDQFYYPGEIGLTIIDNSAWTESRLFDWIDATESLYD